MPQRLKASDLVNLYQNAQSPNAKGLIWWMRRTGTTAKEKADVVDHPQGFDRVGLLVSEPPGQAGLPLVLSSDDFRL